MYLSNCLLRVFCVEKFRGIFDRKIYSEGIHAAYLERPMGCDQSPVWYRANEICHPSWTLQSR